MIMNLRILKDMGWRAFGEALDHRNLGQSSENVVSLLLTDYNTVPISRFNVDLDVPYFSSRPSTMENLAVFVYQRLASVLQSEGYSKAILYEVQIVETAYNSVVYRGED